MQQLSQILRLHTQKSQINQEISYVIIKKQMSDWLQNYKQFKKIKLLNHLRENENYEDMINTINPTNVDNFDCWADETEKQNIIDHLLVIETIQKVEDEDGDEFRLTEIIKKIQAVSFYLTDSSFVSFILSKNKHIKLEDFAAQGYKKIDVNNISQLLNHQDFKKWCKNYNPNIKRAPLPQPPTHNAQGPQTTISSNSTPNQYDKLLNDALYLKQNETLNQFQFWPINQRRIAEIEEKLQKTEEEYGKGKIIEMEILKEQLSFRRSNKAKPIAEIYGMLERENRLGIESIRLRFQLWSKGGYTQFYNTRDIQCLCQQLTPIDVFKIKVASESSLSPLDFALMIIGETGAGKTTLILKLLGYQLVQKKVNGMSTLAPKKKLSNQHQSLIASASLSSVTQTVTPYKFTHKKTIFLIDSPGTSDTRGGEVDISNQIILENVYKQCKNICYLYLVDLRALSGAKGIMIVYLAKTIAERFTFQTLSDLYSMLLLIFNVKGDKMSKIINDIPLMAKKYLQSSEKDFNLNNREKVALRFVTESLNSRLRMFDPTADHIEEIKAEISNLKYNKKHEIKRTFGSFINKIQQQNKILESNINFYLEQRQFEIVRYHYDQLTILAEKLKHQKVITQKKIIDEKLKRKVGEYEFNLQQTLDEKIHNLKMNKEEFATFIQELQAIFEFIKILKIQDVLKRIYSHLNYSFNSIIEAIDSNSTDEKISKIVEISHFYLSNPKIKEKLENKQKVIEQKCFDLASSLPKQIKYQYEKSDWQEFDDKLDSYIIFYKYYHSFNSLFPQQFKRLHLIKTPEEVKKAYLNSEKTKLNKFITSIQAFVALFSDNNEINQESLTQLNSLAEKCLLFKQSKHISLETEMRAEEKECKKRLEARCRVFTQNVQKILTFFEGYETQQGKVQILMNNFTLIKDSLKKGPLASEIVEGAIEVGYRSILEKVDKTRTQFQDTLQELRAKINNVTQKMAKPTILKEINTKLSFFDILQSVKTKLTYQNLKNDFTVFASNLKQTLQQEFKGLSKERFEYVFNCMISLERYEGISASIGKEIAMIKEAFQPKLDSYLDNLIECIPMKEIRSSNDHKQFAQKYYRAMDHYISNIFILFKEHFKIDEKHKQIFLKNQKCLSNICLLVSKCIEASKQGNSNLHVEPQEISVWLKQGFCYIRILSDVYPYLKRIISNLLFNQYSQNRLHKFTNDHSFTLTETVRSIESFNQDRYDQIKHYTKISNTKISNTKNFDIKTCDNFLKEAIEIKMLDSTIKQLSGNKTDDISLEDIQNSLYQIINKFNEKQFNRIEEAISLDNRTIDMFKCDLLYKQLKDTKQLSTNPSDNIEAFIERLNKFFYSKFEIYRTQLDTTEDFLSQSNITNLIDSMRYSSEFHRFIVPADVVTFRFIGILDQITLRIILEVETKIESRIQDLAEKISLRNFDMVAKEECRLQRILRNISSYLNNMNKLISPPQVTQKQHEKVELSPYIVNVQAMIKKVSGLKDIRKSQAEMDQQIIKEPLSGTNKFKLQDLYSHSKSNGQIRSKIQTNINNAMTKLFSQYNICSYSESSKKAREINEILIYIPSDIATHNNYRDDFRAMQINKTQKEKNILGALQNQDHSKKNVLNKIMRKHIQFSINNSIEMKEESLEIAKKELSKILNEILSHDRLEDSINIAKEKFWELEYKIAINADLHSTIELETEFNNMEKEIADKFRKTIIKITTQFSKIINSDQPTSINLTQVEANVNSLFAFYSTFEEKAQKVHIDERYKNILKELLSCINDWRNCFDLVCPIVLLQQNLYSKDINVNKSKHILKKCLTKASLYNLIFKYFTKFDTLPSSNNSVKSQMDIQQDSTNSTLCVKINNFIKKIEEHYKTTKSKLENIQFQRYINFTKDQIERMLTQFEKLAIVLELYDQIIVSANFGYIFEATNYANIIQDIKKKLQTFINTFLVNLQKAFNNLENEIPQDLYFLQILLEKIESNICRKIFDNRQPKKTTEMVEQTYAKFQSNPREAFAKYIDQLLIKQKDQITKVRRKFCAISKKEYNDEMIKKQDILSDRRQQLYQQYKQSLMRIREMNAGKSQADIKQKEDEALALYNSNILTIEQKIQAQKETITNKFEKLEKQLGTQYSRHLLNLKKLEFHFHTSNSAKAKVAETLKGELQEVKKANKIKVLSKHLELNNFQSYAYLLKSQSKLFKFQYYQEFNSKTKAQTIEYVTQRLKSIAQILFPQTFNTTHKVQFETEIKYVLNSYKDFQDYYDDFIFNAKERENNVSANQKRKKIEEMISQFENADRVKKLAIILAVWSINETTKNYNENGEEGMQEEKSFNIKPHPVQIVALLLLTRTNQKNQFISQLIQVLTGEGKSIILATLAIYFAKLKQNVVVSCYSSYLCNRDFKNFEELFIIFQVKHLISYLTFNEICDKAINNSELNLKEKILKTLVEQSFTDKVKGFGANIIESMTNLFSIKVKNSILLIDEVDVFFEKEYYGKTYKPLLKLNDKASQDFIKFVFAELQKNSKILTKDLAESKEFKAVVKAYPKLTNILHNVLHRMKDEYLHPLHEYFVDEKNIKYKDKDKDKDKLSEKPHYGYETIFAYCREHKNNRISPQNYEKALFIPIIYGEFSYFELPKYYTTVIGLSGTIQHLPKEKINYLSKQYKISKKQMYVLPSIYGEELKRGEAFVITKDNNYYNHLIDIIKKEIGKNRPVLVCFKTFAELQRFNKSKELLESKLAPTYLHEHLDNDLRDRCIKTVGSPGRLTLMTAEFSRGTDFIISDQKVKDNGGLYLILTYISELKSQFIHFCGRTGRQGQKGSIDLIITDSEAASKKIAKIQDEILPNIAGYMDQVSNSEDAANKSNLLASMDSHRTTERNIQNIIQNQEEYIKFLFGLNKYTELKETPTKIVIGIDATCSMQKVILEVITQLTNVMSRISDLVKTNQINGSFQVQIVVYRNYNSGESIIQASKYFDNLENLIPFLSKIKVGGGMGNEAIQLLYRFINLQGDVDMLILIGDAPPNTDAQTEERRKNVKEWLQFLKEPKSKEKLYNPTNCTEELRKFKSQFIIINGLYITDNYYTEKNSTEAYFTKIADRHNGKTQELNFSKKNYSESLIEFFTTRILAATNGGKKSEERIDKLYRDKFR